MKARSRSSVLLWDYLGQGAIASHQSARSMSIAQEITKYQDVSKALSEATGEELERAIAQAKLLLKSPYLTDPIKKGLKGRLQEMGEEV